MASIQSLGVGSGLLTSDLLEDIVAAEREATDLRLDSKRLEVDAEISAFGAIRSELQRLSDATAAVADSTEFLSNLTSSSNPGAIAATADGSAQPAVHTVEVQALARAQTLTSTAYSSPEASIGQGTLTFSFGTTTFDGGGAYDSFTQAEGSTSTEITIDASNNTLGGLRDAVNSAGFGVTASIVDDGTGSVLVFRSDETGLEQSMAIEVAPDSGNPGLEAFAFAAGAATAGTNLTQTVAADDSIVRIDGLQIRRSTNTIDGVVPGVSFTATSLNAGAPATVSVNQDTAAIQERMQAFVEAYNGVKVLTDELTDYDTEAQQGALLTGDSTLRGIQTQLRRALTASVDSLSGGNLNSLVDIGLSTNRDLGFLLRLDTAKFDSALKQDPKGLVALLTDDAQSSDSLIELRNFGSATAAGDYAVVVDQLATNGEVVGATAAGLAGPITIDADNDSLDLSVDGVSTSITLTQGVYADGVELATELAAQINNASVLSAAGRTVDVAFNATDNQLTITSNRFGSDSRVAITGVDTNSAATLGLAVDEGTSGTDVAGSVNGVQGVGTGQFLQIPTGPAPATAATLRSAELSLPVTLADGANTFSLSVDGTSSGTLTIPAGDYDSGSALAEAVTTVLTDAGVAASARFDAGAQRLVLSADSTGRTSTLSIDAFDPTLSQSLGFGTGSSATGTNAERVDNPAGGIQVRVNGGETGSRGSVSVVRGVMNRLDQFFDSLLGSNGALTARVDGLEGRLDEVDEEAADFETRMDFLEERLRFQFAAADALISQLNGTSQFLDQQLASLPGFTRDNG